MAMDINDTTDHNAKKPASSFAVSETLNDVSGTYNERSITYNGSISDLDYDSLLRQKQKNINKFYELCDYFVDADDLVSGAIRHIYVPFSLMDGWYLTGGDDRTREKYIEWFTRIGLNDKLRSWFYQYYLFFNVYFSLMEDGDLVTLPPHLVKITNVLVHGNPLVEFDVKSLKQDLRKSSQRAWKKFLDDEEMKVRIAGYPKEVNEALYAKNSVEWVQLNPKSTWVWQGDKPEWSRYAIPLISTALIPLSQKALIRQEENALLNLAAASFVHGAVGSPKDSNIVVDTNILNAVMAITKNAMKAGGGIAITNDCVTYQVIQPDLDHFYEADKYKSVNESILGAFGINASVSSGSDNSVSFGSSQISTKLVSMRINTARKSLCKLVNKIMRGVNGAPYGLPRSNDQKIPTFVMPETDLTQVAAFQNECMKLYEKGVLSVRTLLESYNISLDTEKNRKTEELAGGITELFAPNRKNTQQTTAPNDGDEEGKIGRPTLDDGERESDPGNSETGRQSKPSRPEGSEKQEE